MTKVELFLAATETRIPTVKEMLELCDELGIIFRLSDAGEPVMTVNADKGNREEAILLAKLFRREPFRSAIIAAKIPKTEEPAAGESKCKSCGAAIRFVKTEAGRTMPIDLEPVDDGTWFLGEDGVVRIMTKEPAELRGQMIAMPLYKSHFATCPNASAFRKQSP
jgi:hypothetical protein